MSEPRQRLDQWLWHARFFKTRTLAGRLCRGRKVRIDGKVCGKASASIKSGVVLTFPQAKRIRVVRVMELSSRRGPAAEAAELYEDLSPPQLTKATTAADVASGRGRVAVRPRGDGRPTKRQRRATDQLRGEQQ